jgi:hypothetical protein
LEMDWFRLVSSLDRQNHEILMLDDYEKI